MTKTRYKKVFSSHDEVSHVWAQQIQDEGRGKNIFFDGDTIYSYGRHFPIARFIDENTVLFNSENYSVSTSKHQRIVSRAISDKTVFEVPSLYPNHDKNIAYFTGMINECMTKSIRARTNKDWLLRSAEGWAEKLKEYAEFFNLEIDESITNREFLSEESREALKVKIDAERKEVLEKRKEEIQEWINGERLYLSREIGKIFLRRIGDEVQTSYGATVKATEARLLHRCIEMGRPVHGHKIGYYTVHTVTDKHLKVGCHTIERSEINRFVKTQNW